MNFDISILNDLIKDTASPAEERGNRKEPQKSIRSIREIDNMNQAEQRAIEIYRVYQENIKTSEILQSKITKGIQAGEKPELLLLKAVKCISLMTGNELFYTQAENDIKKVYVFDTPDDPEINQHRNKPNF